MQYEITDEAATEFGRSFYEAIADGSPVDIAVAEARKSVSIQMSNTLEWGTPVLFMRTDDGVLFRIRRTRTQPIAPPTIGAAPTAPPSVPTEPSSSQFGPESIERAASAPSVAPAGPAGPAASSPVDALPIPSPPTVVGPRSPKVQDRRRTGFVVAGGIGLLAVGVLAWSVGRNGGGPGSSFTPGVSSASVPTATSTQPGSSSSPGTPASPGGVLPVGTIDIAVALQDEGSSTSNGILNGIKLALTDAGSVVGGWQVPMPNVINYDHRDVATGRANMTSIVDLDTVVAVVGPQMSSVARGQIPITNEAGLLQCSPSTASDGLTKPPDALTLRESHPTRINFVRTVTTNAADGPAAAQFILKDLGRSRVFIVDNGVPTARERTRLFKSYFTANGGTVVGESSAAADTDIASTVTLAQAADPDVLYFSGSSTSQGLMTQFYLATRSDLGALPFLASGEIKANDTFSNDAGARASNNIFTFVAAAQDFVGSGTFKRSYNAAYGTDPGPYSSTAYACTTVILDAIKRAGTSTSLLDLRERVRAAAVDPAVTYDTAIGSFHFDENGDTSKRIVSVYRYEPTARNWPVQGFVDLVE
jgi:branched-chain amino acid transport system substrate-binding protein